MQGIIAAAGGKEVVAIDIEDDGTVMISSPDADAAKLAEELVKGQTVMPEVGQIYDGEVKAIQKDRNTGKEIGAIVQIFPNKDGMVHISQISDERVERIEDVLKIGQVVKVKVMEIDKERGRVSLSIKVAK